MNYLIRNVSLDDSQAILDIYTPYITDSCITFETEVPTLYDFKNRIKNITKSNPYIVYVEDEKVLGYAYASKYKDRAAYVYTVESSIYVDINSTGKNIGKLLYSELLERLKKQNINSVYACITLPNDRSIKLHKNFGFNEIGIFKEAGFKFNKWLDIVWYQKQLRK